MKGQTPVFQLTENDYACYTNFTVIWKIRVFRSEKSPCFISLTWPAGFGIFVSEFLDLFQCLDGRHREQQFAAAASYNVREYPRIGLHIGREQAEDEAVEHALLLRLRNAKHFNNKRQNFFDIRRCLSWAKILPKILKTASSLRFTFCVKNKVSLSDIVLNNLQKWVDTSF